MKLALLLLLARTIVSAQQQQPVAFPSLDGVTVHADEYGSAGGRRAVVLVHGGRFTKEGWKPQAEILARHGFRVLAIDFRGSQDVLAAQRFLHANGAKSVSVVGGSMGGDAAGDASVEAKPGEIDRIVILASQGGDAPGRMKGRKLFILARDDSNGAGPRLPGIQKAFNAAPKPKKLVILPGSAHAQFLFGTAEGPRLMQEILQFLEAR